MSARAEKVAWAAGFFDGEGCISISRNRKRQPARLQCIVVQKSITPIEEYCELWPKGGVNITHRNQPSGRVGYYRWTISGANAADMLQEMYPYLLEKKDQAYLAIEFQDTVNAARFKYGKKGLPPEALAYRNQVAEKLSALKRRAGATTESLGVPLKVA